MKYDFDTIVPRRGMIVSKSYFIIYLFIRNL